MNPIEPTLDDDGIMDFVASGFVVLESVVMETYNRCCDGLTAGNAVTKPSGWVERSIDAAKAGVR